MSITPDAVALTTTSMNITIATSMNTSMNTNMNTSVIMTIVAVTGMNIMVAAVTTIMSMEV